MLLAQIDASPLPRGQATRGSLDNMLNIVFGIAGAIGVLMVVIGGLRYITAQGDANGTAQAKKTIIYAIVGVVVTIVSFAVVKWVVLGVG